MITKLELELQQIIEKKLKEGGGYSNLSVKQDRHRSRGPKDISKAGKDRKRSNSKRRGSQDHSGDDRSRSGSAENRHKRKSRKNSGDDLRMVEEKTKSRSCLSHSGDEEFDESLYVDVPIEAFLLKKNFDYILIDKDDILQYTGKSETKINQLLKVPYHGTLQLASYLVAQMFADSRFDIDSDEESIIINEDIFISKPKGENVLLFRWVASQKNDIIADCLAYMFSQFPDDAKFDIFNIDPAKSSKEIDSDILQKKVIKRILKTFHGYVYRIDRQYLHFREGHSEFTVNLKTGKVESRDEALAGRVLGIISNLF